MRIIAIAFFLLFFFQYVDILSPALIENCIKNIEFNIEIARRRGVTDGSAYFQKWGNSCFSTVTAHI